MPAAIGISSLARWSRRAWSGVRARSRDAAPAIRPISVSAPVAVTTKRPRPRATVVPASTQVRRSAGGASAGSGGSARLLRGTDSPVSADSSICRSVASSSRPSAGTRSPAADRDDVSGDDLLRGAFADLTVAHDLGGRREQGTHRRCRLVRAPFLDRSEHRVGDDDRQDHAGVEPLADRDGDHRRARSSSTIEFANWRASSVSRDGAGSVRGRFGPLRPSRRAASASPRPVAASTSSASQTSGAGCAYAVLGVPGCRMRIEREVDLDVPRADLLDGLGRRRARTGSPRGSGRRSSSAATTARGPRPRPRRRRRRPCGGGSGRLRRSGAGPGGPGGTARARRRRRPRPRSPGPRRRPAGSRGRPA